jgi:hypothetical protein
MIKFKIKEKGKLCRNIAREGCASQHWPLLSSNAQKNKISANMPGNK